MSITTGAFDWASLVVQLLLLGRLLGGLCGFVAQSLNHAAMRGGTPKGPNMWFTGGSAVGLVASLGMIGVHPLAWAWPIALWAAVIPFLPCPDRLKQDNAWDPLRVPAVIVLAPLALCGAAVLAVAFCGIVLALPVGLVAVVLWFERHPAIDLGLALVLFGGYAAVLVTILADSRRRASRPDDDRWLTLAARLVTTVRLMTAGVVLGILGTIDLWRAHIVIPRASAPAVGCLLAVLVVGLARGLIRTPLIAALRGAPLAAGEAAKLVRYLLIAGLAGAGVGALAMPHEWRWTSVACLTAALSVVLSGRQVPTTDAEIHRLRWPGFLVLAAAVFMLGVDHTILNVALPTMRIDLHLSAEQSTWVVDGYLLPFAALLLTTGALGDKFGRRPFLMAGLALFGGGAALATVVTQPLALIGARALMGLGAAAVMPVTLSTLSRTFPIEERRLVTGLWSGFGGLGLVLGPTLGGWLLAHWGWRAVFVANIPVAAVTLLLAWKLVPETSPGRPEPLDVVGAVLSLVGLGSMLWGIIDAPEYGWTDWRIGVAFAFGFALLAVFGAYELRSPAPMLDLRLLKNRRFTAASLTVALTYFGLAGTLYLLASYLQVVRGYSAEQAGVRFLPVGFLIVAGISAPQFAKRLGSKWVMAAGLGAITGALLILASVGAHSPYWAVALALGLGGGGMGFATAPATGEIMAALPESRAGVTSALNDTNRLLGSALGVAILATVTNTLFGDRMAPVVAPLGLQGVAARNSVDAAAAIASSLGRPGLGEIARVAYVHAMADAMIVAAVVLGVALLVVVGFMPDTRQAGFRPLQMARQISHRLRVHRGPHRSGDLQAAPFARRSVIGPAGGRGPERSRNPGRRNGRGPVLGVARTR